MEVQTVKQQHDIERVLESTTRVLALYVRGRDPKELFGRLLFDVLDLTGSDYGYIAEVLRDEEDAPYLRTWAITDVSWNEETRELYQQFAVRGGGLEFKNLDTLFGWGLREGGRLVIANDTAADPRCSGRPGGHPPLDNFLGIPVYRGGELVGQIAVANRADGYDQSVVSWLEPFVAAVGNLIEAYRVDSARRTAEDALASSERRFSAIVSNMSDIVTLLGSDGAWLYSSPAANRILGYGTGFRTHNPNILDLLHPDDVALALEAFDQVLRGRRGLDEPLELRVQTVDGSYRVLETVGDDLRDDPAVGAVVLTSHDVTERMEAEAQLRETTIELSALVSALRDGVLFMGDDHKVVFVNEAFRAFAGVTKSVDDLIGTPGQDLLERICDCTTHPAQAMERLQSLHDMDLPQLGEILRTCEGRVLERDYMPVVLEGTDRHGHLWLFRDVTERVAAEEHRIRMFESERQMREAIEEQNRSLRELDNLKNEFVATVSHELRTPLTAISNFASILSEESDQLSDEQQEFLEIIGRNSQRLLRLVGDLLLVARLESGTLEIDRKPISLRRAVESTLDGIRPEAEAGGVEVHAAFDDDPTPLMADGGRIEQVVANLVSNAVKFTPARGTVEVATERVEGAWLLTVRDTGIGIPAAELDRLFQRFFRGSNARLSELPGTGLGLAITNAIVGLHDGSMQIESEEGRGTTVTVRLPDDVPEPGSPADSAHP